MTFLLDTSILVAAVVEAHPAHESAFPWLYRVKQQQDRGLVAAHSIAETYAILTTLPIQPKIAPILAQQLIQQDILTVCQIIPLSEQDYQSVIKHLAAANLTGGIIYDALIVYAAVKASADQVITLNARDFRRIYPEFADRIVSPLK